jgi:hypothetical protein
MVAVGRDELDPQSPAAVCETEILPYRLRDRRERLRRPRDGRRHAKAMAWTLGVTASTIEIHPTIL